MVLYKCNFQDYTALLNCRSSISSGFVLRLSTNYSLFCLSVVIDIFPLCGICIDKNIDEEVCFSGRLNTFLPWECHEGSDKHCRDCLLLCDRAFVNTEQPLLLSVFLFCHRRWRLMSTLVNANTIQLRLMPPPPWPASVIALRCSAAPSGIPSGR